MSQPVDIAVIVLGMNTRNYVHDCLTSLREANWGRYRGEIVYVDNASKDDSVAWVKQYFPEVRVIANTANLGFCRGANDGSRRTESKYLLHLNNDTIVYPDAIQQMMDYAESHPAAAVVGCRLLNPDLTDQWSARRFPSLKSAIVGRRSWLHRVLPHQSIARAALYKEQLRGSDAFQVDWVGTPCMLVLRDVFQQVGGFPEDFYYWHEAVFCHRVSIAGGGVFVVPTAKVIHYEGRGGGPRPYPVRKWHIQDFHRGAFRFYCEHHNLPPAHPGRWFTGAALASRAAILMAANLAAHLGRRQ